MSEPFTDAHVHFWDHALPGMRWRFLEPDFEHPRFKGTQRLDTPRCGPMNCSPSGSRASGQGRPHPVRDAARADIHAGDRLAGVSSPTATDIRRRSSPGADAGARCAGDGARRQCQSPRFRGVRDLSVMTRSTPAEVEARSTPPTPTMRRGVDAVDGALRLGGRGLAERWPDVTIVLGHAGQPLARPEYVGGGRLRWQRSRQSRPTSCSSSRRSCPAPTRRGPSTACAPRTRRRSPRSVPIAACSPATGRSTACTARTHGLVACLSRDRFGTDSG